MATAFSERPLAPSFVHLAVKVGVADWTIIVEPCTAAKLSIAMPSDASDAFPEAAVARILNAARAKAVALRWYGGGTLSINAGDIGPDFPPIAEGEAHENTPPRWFEILGVTYTDRPVLALVSA
jgi:hypothetical protein